MRNLTKLIAAAALGAGALAVTATTASAAIVCNRHGECWHVRAAHKYPMAAGVVVHPNNWRWAAHEKFVWREHTGRGYWRNGVWIRF